MAPGAIATDANNLYWTADNSTYATPLTGGPTTAIGPDAAAFAVDATDVYYSVNDNSADTGSIIRAPIGGGVQTVVASGRPGSLEAVAVDDTSVYWIEGSGTIGMAAVARLDKASGAIAVLASGASSAPSGLAVDETSVYVALEALDVGAIEKIAK